jgi:hypothetical protein
MSEKSFEGFSIDSTTCPPTKKEMIATFRATAAITRDQFMKI